MSPDSLTPEDRDQFLAEVQQIMQEQRGLTLAQAARIALRRRADAPPPPPPEPPPPEPPPLTE